MFKEHTHAHTHSHTWAQLCKFYYAALAQLLSRASIKRSLLLVFLEPLKNKHQLHILPWPIERSKVVKRHTFNLKMWLCFLKITDLRSSEKDDNISLKGQTLQNHKIFFVLSHFLAEIQIMHDVGGIVLGKENSDLI